MKSILIVLAVFINSCILLSHLSAQKIRGFTLNGKLKGLKDNTLLYLLKNKADLSPGADTVAITRAKNETFVFKGKVSIEPEAHFIFIEKDSLKYPKPIRRITVLLENREINLEGSIENTSVLGIKVEGSKTHNEFIEYNKFNKALVEPVTKEILKINEDVNNNRYDTTISYGDRLRELQKPVIKAKMDWIAQHPNSFLTPWVIMNNYSDLKELKLAYDNLTDLSKRSKYGRDLKILIDREDKIDYGKIAPDFTFPSFDGTQLTLSKIVGRGKITLIDFWASWCKPCRAEFPRMKDLYSRYKEKGLVILGFSIDENEILWKNAVEKEKLEWLNVRQTTKGFAKKEYGIDGVPNYYILDKNGRIIARNIYDQELEEKIKQLLNEEE